MLAEPGREPARLPQIGQPLQGIDQCRLGHVLGVVGIFQGSIGEGEDGTPVALRQPSPAPAGPQPGR